MTSGCAVQVFHFQNGRPVFEVQKLTSVLKKVGDRPVAIVSVNGPIRSGKSFLLNFLMRQALLLTSENTETENVLNENYGFKWRSGRERTTIGIDIWSEPFIIKDSSDNEVGVILMDTQGLFDPQTEFSANTLIFCVSVWLSSVFIYNIKGEVSEDRLQLMEYFIYAANKMVDNSFGQSGTLFQKMIILVRDWQNQGDNSFGLHRRIESKTGDDTSWTFDPETKNFIRDFFMDTDTLSEEAIETRRELLDGFEDVSACLLPHPGKEIAENKDGVARNMDADFEEQTIKLAEWVLCSECLVPKKINESKQTGNSFILIVESWVELISKEEMPNTKNIISASAEAKLSTLLIRTQKKFDDKFKVIINSRPTIEEFHTAYQKMYTELLESYKSGSTKSLQERYDKKGFFVELLCSYMNTEFENNVSSINSLNSLETIRDSLCQQVIEKENELESLKAEQLQHLEAIKTNASNASKAKKNKSNTKSKESSSGGRRLKNLKGCIVM